MCSRISRPRPTRWPRAFLAGILRRVPELTVFTNPLPGSYQRLGCCEAPGVVSWSCQNRSSLVRVPAARGADCRMELRSPDARLQPLLCGGAAAGSGAGGRARKPAPCPPAASGDLLAGAKTGGCALPKTLTEAVRLAEQSEFLCAACCPARLLDAYLDRKRRDAAAWAAAPDPHWYEMQTYFDRV